MPNKYGLTTTTNTAKPARASVARWNDGKKRHNVYTACGTTQDGWALYNDPGTNEARQNIVNLAKVLLNNPSLTLADLPADGEPYPFNVGSPDAIIGRAADPELFNWVPISYPASAPGNVTSLENNWQPSTVSMAESAKYGVEETIRQIKANPGTFALVGMSQGAVVMTQVMKALLPGGVLAHRYNDCIAGLAFGNPCRAIGASYPGGVAAPGGGVISFQNQVNPFTGGLNGVKTPDWWWEFCVPGDFFSSAPMDTLLGPLLSPAIQAAFQTPGSLGVNADGLQVILTLMLAGGTVAGVLFAALLRGGVFAVAQQLSTLFSGGPMKGFLSAVSQKQQQSAVGQLSQWVYQQVGTIDIGASIAALSPVIVPSNYYPRGNPHILLGDSVPALPSGRLAAYGPNPAWTISLPGLNSSSSYIDVGQAFLNARGAAIAPR